MMNILVIGNFYTGAFGTHISETLEEMNHQVYKFEPGIKFNHNSIFGKRWNTIRYTLYNEVFFKLSSIQNKNIKPLYKIIENNKIDLTLVLHDYLLPEQVSIIKNKTKSPVVIWFPDALSNFKKSMFLIADFDFLFFVDKYIVDELHRECNLNTFYLPQACYPKYHNFVEMSEKDKQIYGCDITNVGNMYPARIALYKQLTQYNIKMWGDLPAIWVKNDEIKPMLQAKTVHHQEKSKAFNGAKIVLNNLHPAVIDGVNKRTFEICGCGGFQLVKHRPAIEELFVDGEELVTYKDFNDLVNKIDFYLKNESEREKIAKAGMKRAHKDHTLEIRLKEMLNVIFN